MGKEVAEVTGDKKGKKEKRRKGEKVGNMLKASCHTGGNTNKKYLDLMTGHEHVLKKLL